MTTFKDIARGIGYPLRGAVYGLVTGVASSFTYILGRIFLNLPDSVPKVDVTLDARKLDIAALEKCYQEQLTNCTLPINVDLDLDNWTHPILLTTLVATGVGVTAGAGMFMYKQLTKRNQTIRLQYVDGSEDDVLMPPLDSFSTQRNGCC